jgi:hypothetical protein
MVGEYRKVPELVSQWRRKYSVDPDRWVEATLGRDAPSTSPDSFMGKVGPGEEQMPSQEKDNNHFFLFLAMQIEPSLNNFVVHVRSHTSGTLGRHLAAEWTRHVIEALRVVKIMVLATATDGDWSYVLGQNEALARYEFAMIEMMHRVAVIGSEHQNILFDQIDLGKGALICDVLHALKCQRRGIKNLLSFHARASTIAAENLNKVFHLRGFLRELSSCVDQDSDSSKTRSQRSGNQILTKTVCSPDPNLSGVPHQV